MPTFIDRLIAPGGRRRHSLALGLLCLILVGCGDSAFSKLEVLPAASYLQRPGDYLGNTYVVRAQIDSQLKWDRSVGRILAVRPDQSPARLPVFVPESIKENLHIGQRYEMRVRVEDGGLLYVENLRKY